MELICCAYTVVVWRNLFRGRTDLIYPNANCKESPGRNEIFGLGWPGVRHVINAVTDLHGPYSLLAQLLSASQKECSSWSLSFL
jgi:hypothetical protein